MKIDAWAMIATGAGAGLLLFATELAKVIPGPDDQIIAGAGAITALCAMLMQMRSMKKQAESTQPPISPDTEKGKPT